MSLSNRLGKAGRFVAVRNFANLELGCILKLLFDVTTTARTAYDPPVGTTRVERTILADLHRELGSSGMAFVKFRKGRFVRLASREAETIASLIASPQQQAVRRDDEEIAPPEEYSHPDDGMAGPKPPMTLARRVRLIARALVERYPEAYRAQAVRDATGIYVGMRSLFFLTLATLRGRPVRRAADDANPGRIDATSLRPLSPDWPPNEDFSDFTDLITLGNGWDYLDYESLYALKQRDGLRIHGFVHDLITVDYPQFFHNPAKSSLIHRHYAELCHLCDTLICNSFATRDALHHFIRVEGLPEPRIAVAQLPAFASEALEPVQPPDVTDEPFILFVSTIEVRKNHRVLLHVWRECLREGRTMPRLVLVGRLGWGVAPLMEMLAWDPMLQNHVTVLHDITDAQLAWLYDHCLFTVYPSIAEGWGLPIGEALGRGRICLHTSDPAQREAAQNLMPALHPEDFFGWKAAILELIEDPDRRERLEAKVRAEFRPITRERFCAAVREAIAL